VIVGLTLSVLWGDQFFVFKWPLSLQSEGVPKWLNESVEDIVYCIQTTKKML